MVKQRLQEAIGIPASDMKLRLCGHNQMVMIDTASNIKVGSCGVTQGAARARARGAASATGLLTPVLLRLAAVQEVDTGIPLPQSFKFGYS